MDVRIVVILMVDARDEPFSHGSLSWPLLPTLSKHLLEKILIGCVFCKQFPPLILKPPTPLMFNIPAAAYHIVLGVLTPNPRP